MRVLKQLEKTAIRFTTLVVSLVILPSGLAMAAPDLHAVTDGLAIGDAVQHEGLTLYPVLATRELPSGEYLSMQQALTDGSLKINENGGGNVPTLEVVNSGSIPVLLVVGDVVKGGRQDRVIAQDVIVKPTGEPQVVAVNCVESGRWATRGVGAGGGGASFAYGGRGEAELKEVLQHEANQAATWETVAELNKDKRMKLMALSAMGELEEDQEAETVEQVLAASGYEERLPVVLGFGSGSHQRQAYSQLAPLEENLIGPHGSGSQGHMAYAELAPSSGTYMASIDSQEVGTRTDAMVEALLPGLEAELQVVGLVAAVGGELITAELYGDAALFELSKSSILRGLALDALSDELLTHPDPPTAEQAAEFLASALGGQVVEQEELDGASKLRRMTESTSAFEFEATDGDFLHINVYAR
jgi:hypothetical protein